MQYILTEEEYAKLASKEDYNKTIMLNTFYKNRSHYLQEELTSLSRKYKELEDKYTKLLVFGVSSSNERLKSTQR